jgi:hypothetical protein
MIAPAVLLALQFVQAQPVVCDWANRPDGKMYICASPENRSAIVAFSCDEKAGSVKQIFFTIVSGKQGNSGRMSVKNGSSEVQIPMLGLRVGENGFASAAVQEAFDKLKALIAAAKGPIVYAPIDVPDVAPVSIDGAAIATALKIATASCKGS